MANAAVADAIQPSVARPAIKPPAPAKKRVTAGLVTHKTSQTLVEFQNKNASLPDWRIQLQNAVQHRKGAHSETTIAPDDKFSNNKDSALKAAPILQGEIEVAQKISDPRVANAMRRIAESRKTFHEPTPPAKLKKPVAQLRHFGVVAASQATFSAAAAAPAKIKTLPKPTLVSAPTLEKRNTNKLPPIEKASEIAVPLPAIEKIEKAESGSLPFPLPEISRIQIKSEHIETNVAANRRVCDRRNRGSGAYVDAVRCRAV